MLFYYHKDYIFGVGAVFKNIKPRFMKKFISLLIISSRVVVLISATHVLIFLLTQNAEEVLKYT